MSGTGGASGVSHGLYHRQPECGECGKRGRPLDPVGFDAGKQVKGKKRHVILIQASSAARCSGMVAVPKIHPHEEEAWMNFYTHQHKHYCGIDLHARAMYVCILDQHGAKLVHKNLPTTPEAFLRVIAPYKEDIVVGVECMFT